MRYPKKVLGGRLRQYSMVIVLVVLTIIFNIASGGRMITSSNFQNLIFGNVYVLVLTIGTLMVTVIGQIDLFVGSVAGFAGMVMALSTRDFGLPRWLMVLLALAIGATAGAWQGFWLVKLGIPGFIATLSGMMILRGGVIWILRSISVSAPQEFKVFGSGYLPDWGPVIGINNSILLLGVIAIVALAFVQLRGHTRPANLTGKTEELWLAVVRITLVGTITGYLTWVFGTGRPDVSSPVPDLILATLIIIYHMITQRTRFGRHIYAVSSNKTSAVSSGANVQKTYFLMMLNMFLLTASAGIIFVGRPTAVGPSDDTGWELDTIASVFIGGAAASGGVGTVFATMIGGLVMAVLNSELMLMGVGTDRTQVIKGLTLLIAVAFDVLNKQQGRSFITGRLFPIKEGKLQDGKPQKGTPVSGDS